MTGSSPIPISVCLSPLSYTAYNLHQHSFAGPARHTTDHFLTSPPDAYFPALPYPAPVMFGRLFHYTFDAMAVSAVLAGVKKSTGFA